MELDLKDFTGIYIDANILLYSAFNHPNFEKNAKISLKE